jgi:hypothetical protein
VQVHRKLVVADGASPKPAEQRLTYHNEHGKPDFEHPALPMTQTQAPVQAEANLLALRLGSLQALSNSLSRSLHYFLRRKHFHVEVQERLLSSLQRLHQRLSVPEKSTRRVLDNFRHLFAKHVSGAASPLLPKPQSPSPSSNAPLIRRANFLPATLHCAHKQTCPDKRVSSSSTAIAMAPATATAMEATIVDPAPQPSATLPPNLRALSETIKTAVRMEPW